MKRAGKVFLAFALVMAMLWTSTGTSNIPGVLGRECCIYATCEG